MTLKKRAIATLKLLACLIFCGSALAGTLSGKIRVDDEFRLYLSTSDSTQGTLIASGNQWDQTFSISANLVDGQNYYLHVYGKDNGGVAGLLAELNLAGNFHVFSNNSNQVLSNTGDWKVSTSGWSNYSSAANSNGSNGSSSPQIDANATWIWAANPSSNPEVYFSIAIVSQASPSTGGLSGKIRVDNRFSAYLSTDDQVQGTLIGTGTDWQTTFSVNAALTAGQNYYLHIYGKDLQSIAGFLGEFNLSSNDHRFANNQSTILTNTTDWKVSKTGWNNYVSASMVNGNNGVSPWGNNPQISSNATWIWSADAQNDNDVYFSMAIVSQSATATPSLAGYVTADNSFDIYLSTDDNVQGTYLAAGNNWQTTYNFNKDLLQGQNYYLHILAKDSGGLAGFIGDFSLSGEGHVFPNNQLSIATNTSHWKVSKTGWNNYAGASMVNGNNGVAPWGSRADISAGATWIWSSDAENDNQVYFSLAISSEANTPPDDGQCSLIYPSVLQSHSATGHLGVDSGARVINSPSTILPFVTGNINANQGTSCGSADCSVSGQAAEALDLPTFPTFSSNNNYNVSNATLGQGSYNSDTFGYLTVENGTTRFSANHSTYYIKGLTIQNSGKLTLRPGTYWVEQINLNSGNFPGDVQINVEGTGTVYLYVKSGLNTGSNSQINGLTATAALNLSVYQDFNVNANSTVSGVIYTQGNMHINSGSKVTGAVSAGNLQLNSNSTVEYISGLFTSYDFSQICGSPVPQKTPPLAFYQFDEEKWSGSGSVLDSSDNAHHGSPIGSVKPLLPIDQQKSCKAMDVGYNGSFFFTDALNTRLDVDQDIGKAGTVSFWYRSKIAWSSSSSRQLLDASNGFLFLFGKSFYLSLYSGNLEFGMEDSSDKDAVVRASGLNFSANEWVHVAISWDLAADTMAIYVNGVAQAATTNAGLNGQMANLNTLFVGDSRDLYFTGHSTDNSAYGQFDDLRIYQIAQKASDVADDANTLSPCLTDVVNHFRLEHDTQGFTCEAESIVIKACKDENCTQLYDQPTSISLAPGSWSGGNTLTFIGSTTANLRMTSVGTYTMSKTAASENADLRCFFGSSETCNIEFVDAGFEFIGATVNDKTLPDQLAQTQFSNVQLRSVQDDNGVCKAAVTGNQNIIFTFNCDSPDTCLTPLADIAITNANGDNSGTINVNFAANGIASLDLLNYADAGRLALSAQATINGATLLKGTALVEVYPASLQLSFSPAALVYSGSADSDQYTAGKSFQFNLGAYGATGSLLPNYQPEQMQLSVQRTYPTAAGTVDGNFIYYNVDGNVRALGSSTDADLFIDIGKLEFSGGQYQEPNAYYDEVGRIALDVQDFNYLGNKISSQGRLALGHFMPAYYAVETEAPTPVLQNVHTGFSYVGQIIPFDSFPAIKVTAKNTLDQTTYNYDSGDWTFRPTLADVNNALKLNYLDKSGYPGDATVFKGTAPIISGDNNYDGSVVITVPNATIVYNKTDSNQLMFGPVDPFNALLDIVFHAEFLSDNNGVCFRDNYLDTDCNDFIFGDVGGADLRFGRFAFKSTFGPEDEALIPKFAVEYYDQKQWLVNTLDNETLINFSQAANDLLIVKKGDGNDLTNSFDPVTSDDHLLLGIPDSSQDFKLSAPGEVGEVYLRLNPAAAPSGWAQYLNYDWNDDGKICNQAGQCANGNGVDYPQATISFGLFRGNDRVIQWREVFN